MIVYLKQKILGFPKKYRTTQVNDLNNDKTRSEHLQSILIALADGYDMALHSDDDDLLIEQLNRSFGKHHIGFAYEGSGMQFAFRDLVLPGKKGELKRYIRKVEGKFNFIVAVGAGLTLAKIPWGVWRMKSYMQEQDYKSAWCIPDGYGFYFGVFKTKKYIEDCYAPPKKLPDYCRDSFDSGIGRSLWWVKGACPKRIEETIDCFPIARQAMLWFGVGLACTYAAGLDEEDIIKLYKSSADFHLDFLSGIPFAVGMRHDGNNYSDKSEKVCQVLLNRSQKDIAEVTSKVLNEIESSIDSKNEKKENVFKVAREKFKLHIAEWVKE